MGDIIKILLLTIFLGFAVSCSAKDEGGWEIAGFDSLSQVEDFLYKLRDYINKKDPDLIGELVISFPFGVNCRIDDNDTNQNNKISVSNSRDLYKLISYLVKKNENFNSLPKVGMGDVSFNQYGGSIGNGIIWFSSRVGDSINPVRIISINSYESCDRLKTIAKGM